MREWKLSGDPISVSSLKSGWISQVCRYGPRVWVTSRWHHAVGKASWSQLAPLQVWRNHWTSSFDRARNDTEHHFQNWRKPLGSSLLHALSALLGIHGHVTSWCHQLCRKFSRQLHHPFPHQCRDVHKTSCWHTLRSGAAISFYQLPNLIAIRITEVWRHEWRFPGPTFYGSDVKVSSFRHGYSSLWLAGKEVLITKPSIVFGDIWNLHQSTPASMFREIKWSSPAKSDYHSTNVCFKKVLVKWCLGYFMWHCSHVEIYLLIILKLISFWMMSALLAFWWNSIGI